jgi:hypothetical protein
MLNTFNLVAALVMVCLCGWAIMDPKVKDGIVIKIGLMFIALAFVGFFALGLEPTRMEVLEAAQALLHLGLIVCLIGYVVRRRRHAQATRRASDWVDRRTSA